MDSFFFFFYLKSDFFFNFQSGVFLSNYQSGFFSFQLSTHTCMVFVSLYLESGLQILKYMFIYNEVHEIANREKKNTRNILKKLRPLAPSDILCFCYWVKDPLERNQVIFLLNAGSAIVPKC